MVCLKLDVVLVVFGVGVPRCRLQESFPGESIPCGYLLESVSTGAVIDQLLLDFVFCDSQVAITTSCDVMISA
jgi:hypothetical protein